MLHFKNVLDVHIPNCIISTCFLTLYHSLLLSSSAVDVWMSYLAQSSHKADLVCHILWVSTELFTHSLVPDTFIFVKHWVIKYTLGNKVHWMKANHLQVKKDKSQIKIETCSPML